MDISLCILSRFLRLSKKFQNRGRKEQNHCLDTKDASQYNLRSGIIHPCKFVFAISKGLGSECLYASCEANPQREGDYTYHSDSQASPWDKSGISNPANYDEICEFYYSVQEQADRSRNCVFYHIFEAFGVGHSCRGFEDG